MNDNSEMDRATAVHEEYMTEVERLVDGQVERLHEMVRAGAASASATGQGAARIEVTRDGDDITASSGGREVRFHIEEITEVADENERAQKFPAEQAHCTVRAPNGTTETLVLQRLGTGNDIGYAWLHANSQRIVDEADLAAMLRAMLFA